MEPKGQVLKAMKSALAPMSAGQIVEATGLDKKAVDKAMKELKDTDQIFSPKRCFWQPK